MIHFLTNEFQNNKECSINEYLNVVIRLESALQETFPGYVVSFDAENFRIITLYVNGTVALRTIVSTDCKHFYIMFSIFHDSYKSFRRLRACKGYFGVYDYDTFLEKCISWIESKLHDRCEIE